MAKRMVFIAVVAAVLLAALWQGASLFGRRDVDSEVRHVTMPVRRQPLSITISGSGPLTSAERATIKAGTTGTVLALPVQKGHPVAENAPAVELDNSDLRLQVRELENDIALALHQLKEAFGLTPDQPMPADPQEILYVRSPISGRLVHLSVAAGDEVRAGQLLARIVDDKTMALEVLVTSTEARSLSPGDPVDVSIDGFSGYIPGVIATVDSKGVAGAISHWYPVSVSVANDGVLAAGTRGTATFGANGFSRSGTLAWSEESSIIATVNATVAEAPVRVGHPVEDGQLLVRFQAEPLLTRIATQRLSLERLRLRQAQVLADMERLTALSPIAGHVVDHHVAVGDSVRPGDPLVTVASFSSLMLTIPVDELEIASISLGQTAAITVEAAGNGDFSAVVREIALEGTARDGVTTFDVTLEIDNAAGLLRSGMTAAANLVVASQPDALVVPAEAVIYDGPRTTVRVLVGDQIELREVTVGTVSTRYIEILSGLDEGELVVVADIGGQSLVPSFGPMSPGGLTRQRPGQ